MVNWTDDMQKRLELLTKIMTASDAAKELDVSRNAVIGRARRTGVKLLPKGHPLIAAKQAHAGDRFNKWRAIPANEALRVARLREAMKKRWGTQLRGLDGRFIAN